MRRVHGTLSNNNMERSGVREAYNLILEDLDYAIDYGPVYKDVFSASRGLQRREILCVSKVSFWKSQSV